MKRITLHLLFVFLTLSAFAQDSVSYSIRGQIKTPGKSHYAYLHFLGNTAAEKGFVLTKIKDDSFSFQGKEALNGRLHVSARLILSENELTKKTLEFISQSPEMISNRNYRVICLEENVMVEIANDLAVSDALVSGGDLNKANDAMKEVIRTKKFHQFFKHYHDSPISLVLLSSMLKAQDIIPA